MPHVCLKHRGMNLAKEFPNLPAPAEVREATPGGHLGRFEPVCHYLGSAKSLSHHFEKVAWCEWIPTRWKQEYDENILSFLEDLGYERHGFIFFPDVVKDPMYTGKNSKQN